MPQYSLSDIGQIDRKVRLDTQGQYYGWGWLSTSEIAAGLARLGINGVVCPMQEGDKLPFDDCNKGLVCIMLKGGHYTMLVKLSSFICFFDALGFPVTYHFPMCNAPILSLSEPIQPMRSSNYCGCYCLFVAYMLTKKRLPHTNNGGELKSSFRSLLQRYMDCSSIATVRKQRNEKITEMFMIDHSIGEEFTDGEMYAHYQRYRKDLSPRNIR
ncbi:LO8 [Rhynchobatus djiddensis adomavirus 1]|uniref:LO8 n=1 Tax=Rhynchobatus djiddensis adomavirus 1 TaxID=2175117 RepID=A0A2S1MK27_9VIRU|nr:LO8 [Rhynchobatus djiddensis adomavirus 1]AWG87399.1 LO8 [Rhynchobatus djiddensis adomavirus 1]